MSRITLGKNILALGAIRGSKLKIVKVFERLSSGQRINSAKDDPSGLAIIQALNSDSRVYTQALRNINDGISYLSLADAALEEAQNIVGRLSELANQASNGTFSDTQRQVIDREAQALADEYQRIINSTSFNDISIFNSANDSTSIQFGYGEENSLEIGVSEPSASQVQTGDYFDSSGISGPSSTVTAHNEQMESGDFNNDGNLDVIARVSNTNIRLFLGQGDGSFVDGNVLGNPRNDSIVVGDINNDGNLDFLYTDSSSNEIVAMLGDGTGSFSASNTATDFGSIFNINEVELTDFDNDGNLDFLYARNSSFSVAFGNGDGTFSAASSFASSANSGVATADFNGDGNMDVIISQSTLSRLYIHFGDGSGSFSAEVSVAASQANSVIDSLDIDNDGDIDLVGVGSTGGVAIYENDGSGNFTGSIIDTLSGSGQSINITDIDGDNYDDIVIGSNSPEEISVFINQDGLGFTNAQTISSLVSRDLTSGDFNNDGFVDIIGTSSGFNPLINFLGTGVGRSALEFSLATVSDARSALSAFEDFATSIAEERGKVGTKMSRLSFTTSSITSLRDNYEIASSRIMDADIASEVVELVRLQILQQTNAALIAQSNLSRNILSKLLDF